MKRFRITIPQIPEEILDKVLSKGTSNYFDNVPVRDWDADHFSFYIRYKTETVYNFYVESEDIYSEDGARKLFDCGYRNKKVLYKDIPDYWDEINKFDNDPLLDLIFPDKQVPVWGPTGCNNDFFHNKFKSYNGYLYDIWTDIQRANNILKSYNDMEKN